MAVRDAVRALVGAGVFPSEDSGSLEEIERTQRLLEEVTPPVSDDEAQLLLGIFGRDGCFGLSWSLLHLIETAPGATRLDYSAHADNIWIQRMQARADFWHAENDQ